MFIDGHPVPSPESLAVVNPWTGEPVGEVPRDSPADVARAAKVVRSSWRPLPPHARRQVLERAAEAVTARSGELAMLATSESGVCVKETTREVARAALNLRVAAVEAERLHGETIPLAASSGGKLAFTLYEPVGVVAGITPFNRPLNQVVVKAAPAVAAGCALVIKPSEKTPLSALTFARILVESGFPADLLAVVTGDPEVIGPALAGSPDVDMVTFTGRGATGRSVASIAAGKKLLLELGGNDPLVVLADADLELAAQLAADGAFATAGQSCRGVKRIIAAETVADDLGALLAEAAGAMRVGDPADPDVDVGPLVDTSAAESVAARVRAAVAAGARVVHGGGQSGSLVEPTVLDHVPPGAELVREETLGPVAPIIRVRDLDEAVAVANGTPYGLQAGVVTRDAEAFLHLAGALRVGAVNLADGPNFDSPHIPFGGVKASGVGREGIRYAIREMCVIKTVTVPYAQIPKPQ